MLMIACHRGSLSERIPQICSIHFLSTPATMDQKAKHSSSSALKVEELHQLQA